jgi:hypothetical protein
MTPIMGSRHTNQVKTQTALQNNVRQMSRILSSSLIVFIEDNQLIIYYHTLPLTVSSFDSAST